jgi:DNA-binding Lrp family transcriptional regulator
MPIYLEKEKEVTVISEEYPDAGYLVIPKIITQRKDLNPNDKLVYALISSFTDNGQDFYGSNGYIERQIGASQNTVQASLKKLEALELIERKIVNRNERTIRVLPIKLGGTSPKDLEGASAKIGEGVPKRLGIYTQVYTQEDTQVYKDKINKHIYNYKNSPDVGSSSIGNKSSFPIENKKPAECDHRYQVFMDKFNSLRGTSYKVTPSVIKLYDYWNGSFNEGQILEAVANIPKHRWLNTIDYSPTIFLRTNKDWIDQCLNIKSSGVQVFRASKT